MTRNNLPGLRRAAALLLLGCALGSASAAAKIVIVNNNEPGVGFNDATPVAPIGGNKGTTLGQQRLLAFQHAAGIWAATLTSKVTVRIGASFVPLACSADSAVLGSAGANDIFADFPNAPKPDTWYPSALASKIAGVDQAEPGEPHIRARFNSRLGLFPDCMPGNPFYLGLDSKHGTQIDLVAVLLHEMAHGLGFQTFTDGQSGERAGDKPSVWDHFMLDNRSDKLWLTMDDAERRASALSTDGLSWNGANVSNAVPFVLAPKSNLAISGAGAGEAAGNYDVGDASFGPPLGMAAVSGQLMPVAAQAGSEGLACTALDAANALAVKDNIALVERGGCAFTDKAKHLQQAGARAMIVADNAPGAVTGLGGADPGIAIPAVRITQQAGATLKARLLKHNGSASGVVASLGLNPDRLAGTDHLRRILLFTPAEYSPGSSVSHFSTDAKQNQLMEPSINDDLKQKLVPPFDLTTPLLKDIGW
ncbi:MAG: PA domain-containing protein [Pseudomonadota bacterium]